MKFILALLAITIFNHAAVAEEKVSTSTTMSAEAPVVDDEPKSMKIQLNPQDFLAGHYRIEVSNRVEESPISLGIMFEKTEKSLLADKYSTIFEGFAAGVHGSYFFAGSPFVTSNFATLRADAYVGSWKQGEYLGNDFAPTEYQSYLFSALFGRQWHWDNFNFSASFGGAYNKSDSLFVKRVAGYYEYRSDEEKTDEFFLVGDVSLGLSF